MSDWVMCLKDQIAKWREVNEWLGKNAAKERISDATFTAIEKECDGQPPQSILFYGFGDDGEGNADSFLSGHLFLTYLTQKYPNERSPYVNFYPSPPDPAHFDFYRPKTKLREGASVRPKGFYVKSLLPRDAEAGIGATYSEKSPADVRKLSSWGWGPEGFQFLAIHEGYVKRILEKQVPTFVLGDYAIAPYGGSEFYSAPLLGPCRGRLEIGATNVRDNIPKYAPSHLL